MEGKVTGCIGHRQLGKGQGRETGGACRQPVWQQHAALPARLSAACAAAVRLLACMHCMNIWSMAMQRALPPCTLPSA